MRITSNIADRIHVLSSYHKNALKGAKRVGCFFCKEIYHPREIKEWIDGGNTALCPKCGIDTVIPEGLVELTPELLGVLCKRNFKRTNKRFRVEGGKVKPQK